MSQCVHQLWDWFPAPGKDHQDACGWALPACHSPACGPVLGERWCRQSILSTSKWGLQECPSPLTPGHLLPSHPGFICPLALVTADASPRLGGGLGDRLPWDGTRTPQQ